MKTSLEFYSAQNITLHGFKVTTELVSSAPDQNNCQSRCLQGAFDLLIEVGLFPFIFMYIDSVVKQLRTVPTNTEVFLRVLRLCGKSRS